jgi:hypothetical protein
LILFVGVSVTDVIKRILPVAETYRRLDIFVTNKLALKSSGRNTGGFIMQSLCSALISLKRVRNTLFIDSAGILARTLRRRCLIWSSNSEMTN